MRLSTRMVTLVAAVIALVCISAPAFASRAHATGTTVTVKASEFKFKLSTSTAPKAGKVTFNLINVGHLPHDFKIAGKKTSLVNPGKSTKLVVTLKAGKYKYICTVAGHAAAGMRGTFTVK